MELHVRRKTTLLSALWRAFESRLNSLLLGHVFALLGCTVKRRSLPVIDACLGVNPNQAMTATRRLGPGRLFGRAPGGNCVGCRRLCSSLENTESCDADYGDNGNKFRIHISVSRRTPQTVGKAIQISSFENFKAVQTLTLRSWVLPAVLVLLGLREPRDRPHSNPSWRGALDPLPLRRAELEQEVQLSQKKTKRQKERQNL
jgi:hypothetical protein